MSIKNIFWGNEKIKDVQNCLKWQENVSNRFLIFFAGIQYPYPPIHTFIQKFKMFGFFRNGEKCFPRYPPLPKKSNI